GLERLRAGRGAERDRESLLATASFERERFDPRAEADRAVAELSGQGPGERAQSFAKRTQETLLPGLGRGARRADETSQDASVFLLELDQRGEHGAGAEAGGVSRVDPRSEWGDEVAQDLRTETAGHEIGERFVASLRARFHPGFAQGAE